MKTKFEVVFETKDMKTFTENEDGTGENLTSDIERALHERLTEVLDDYIISGRFEEEVMEDTGEAGVEGVECFDDYGSVTIKTSYY